jgi:hypothetical protein
MSTFTLTDWVVLSLYTQEHWALISGLEGTAEELALSLDDDLVTCTTLMHCFCC